MWLGDKLREMVKSWLNIRPAQGQAFVINEDMDHQANCIRNQIWYRGDSHELSEFYGQLPYAADTFWGAAQTADIRIKKSHTGLPKLIIKTLVNTVVTDYSGDDASDDYWEEVKRENKFDTKMLKKIVPSISNIAILEWVDGSKVDFKYKRGRLTDIIFKSYHEQNNKVYLLEEDYGYGYITYKLYDNDKEVKLNTVEELKDLKDIEFDKETMWAVPIMFNESPKFAGRGESIFDGKYDSFDSIDEITSQWLEAVRNGRAVKYIPEDLLPKDAETGEVLMPNPFDNKFIKTQTSMNENTQNKIDVEQPEIPTDQYLQSYITFLDLCLQGIISPSTLGIDNKKLDNAEAQREKEKTTLYTRGIIIDTLTEFIPSVINTVLKSKAQMNNESTLPEDKDISTKFGEYANPSFEAQIETVSKGKTGGVMSIEASVDELYGDSKTEEWKQQEVQRLKAEQGIVEENVPALNGELDINEIDIEDTPNNSNNEDAENKEIDKQEKGINE
jgi:hypothetical protein